MDTSGDGNTLKMASSWLLNQTTKKNPSNIILVHKSTLWPGTPSMKFFIVGKKMEASTCGISKQTFKKPSRKGKKKMEENKKLICS